MSETTEQNETTRQQVPHERVVSLASLREMFYDYQEENGRLPGRVHLTKQQIKGLAQEAEMLGMPYETKEPRSVWSVAIVKSDTGPHLAG